MIFTATTWAEVLGEKSVERKKTSGYKNGHHIKETENWVLRYVAHRICQGVLYTQNVIRLYGVQKISIVCPASIFMQLAMFNSFTCRFRSPYFTQISQ